MNFKNRFTTLSLIALWIVMSKGVHAQRAPYAAEMPPGTKAVGITYRSSANLSVFSDALDLIAPHLMVEGGGLWVRSETPEHTAWRDGAAPEGDCSCRNVNFTLDSGTGTGTLTPGMVGAGSCDLSTSSVVVVDNNPSNKEVVDCPGLWTYGLFDASGTLICWGKVTAEDRSGPLLVEVNGRCNRAVAGSASNGIRPAALSPVSIPALTWRDTFLSTDVQKVFNNPLSWDGSGALNSGYSHYAGGVRFEDACNYSEFCDCRTDVKSSDQITFYQCNTISANQIWARIERTFTATDCRGNTTVVVQDIYFIRPEVKKNVYAPEITLRDSACSSDATVMLADFKKRFYIFTDTFSCNKEKYAYFPEAVSAGNAIKRLDNNFSFDIESNADFPVCNNGRKLLVTVTSFDWCTGGKNPLDTITLKWSDATPPTIKLPSKPIVLSTGVLDCTASFGIDKAGLKDYFGVELADNCGTVNVATRIESCTDSMVLGIPVAGKAWRKPVYQTVSANGRLLALGIPSGQHRLIITAFDGCFNQVEETLYFVVADKIAPVMKCESQLNITLSTSNYNPYAQYDPNAIRGYAKVFADEIDKGSSDNCGMQWVRVRRAYVVDDLSAFIARGYDSDEDGDIDTDDGVDWNSSGVIGDTEMEKFEYSKLDPTVLMTPALDYVEFFCGDVGDAGVLIELWGKDKSTVLSGCAFPLESGGVAYPATSGANMSYCWQKIKIEDKTNPTFQTPETATIYCTDRTFLDSLKQPRTVNTASTTYTFLEDSLFAAQNLGRFTVLSGADCQDLDVRVAISPNLHCEAGTITLTYTASKVVKGVPTYFPAGTTTIEVLPVHAYSIFFPSDIQTTCASILDTADILSSAYIEGCDILGVHVEDKRYNNSTTGPDACYRVFRTFTVVNWCQYEESCGDFKQWAIEVPRDPAGDGNDGVNVLVRDAYLQGQVENSKEKPGRDGIEEIYFEDRADAALGPDGFTGSGLSVQVNGVPEHYERINPTTGTNGLSGSYALNSAFSESYPKLGLTPSSSTKTRVDLKFNNPAGMACADAPNYFAWSFTQILYIQDVTPPVVDNPGLQTFYQNKNTCTSNVSFQVTAQDACAPGEIQQVPALAGNLAIERARIRVQGGALQEISAIGASITPNTGVTGTQRSWTFNGPSLPLGNHSLVVVVRDDCGNLSAEQEMRFVVQDSSATAPICFHGLSSSLLRNPITLSGEATVWATDFIASPVDDCNGQGPEIGPTGKKLIKNYYIVRDNGDGVFNASDGLDAKGFPLVKKTSVSFTCQDLLISVILMRIISEDAFGNLSFCDTHLLLNDPGNACSSALASAAIGGAIATETQVSVQGVQVHLTGQQTMSYLTDGNGAYTFSDLPKGKDYTITPYLDDNHRNGVSTFDMVLISKHILGVQPLNSPYKIIAADINNSKSVTTLDLIHLRKLILGIDVKFSNSTSWRFVPKSVQFSNPLNPWLTLFSGSVQISALSADTVTPFVAIKVGDVNGNATASSTVRTNGTFGLRVREQMLIAGNTYRIPVYASLNQVEGFQFTLEADPLAVDLMDMEFGVAKEENIGVYINEGLIATSWNRTVLKEQETDSLFVLTIQAKEDIALSKVLQLNGRIAAPEAYREGGDFLAVQLVFELPTKPEENGKKFELLQNAPNPFNTETAIRFYLPCVCEATLSIQDVTGRVLHTIRGDFQEGYNMVTLKAGDLNTSGVLYYTLKAGTQVATLKMILLA